MDIIVLTIDDLQKFKDQIVEELKAVLNDSGQSAEKKWLKATEVRKLLGISDSKLQRLRISGTLTSSKIGGVHYYELTRIQALFKIKENRFKVSRGE